LGFVWFSVSSSCLHDFSFSCKHLHIWISQVVCHDHGATPRGPQGGHPGVGHSHSQGRPAGASPTACSQAGALLQVSLLPAMTWMILQKKSSGAAALGGSHYQKRFLVHFSFFLMLLNAWNQSNQACCWRCSVLWEQPYH